MELLKLGPKEWTRDNLPALEGGDSVVLNLAKKYVVDASFPATIGAHSASHSAVLTPTVIEMDPQGRAVAEHATVSPLSNIVPTEAIPWAKWVELEASPDEAEEKMGKCLLESTIRSMHGHILKLTFPLFWLGKGKVVQALTTESVAVGALVRPLFFWRPHSMVMENEPGVRHPKGVTCTVEWATDPSALERSKGLEVKEVKLNVFISPDYKLPKAKSNDFDWTKTEDVHPFWFIKRSGKEEDVANMPTLYEEVTHIIAGSYKALVKAKAKVIPQTYTFTVSYPCLVNTVPIPAGKEVILNWKAAKRGDKGNGDAKRKTALDQIAQEDKKQRKAKTKMT